MWSTPEEIAAGKEMWMNLLNWVFARMKAKELEVKGIGSARLRAVIHRDEEPEAWPGPPPIFIALDEEHTVLDVVLQPLRWLRAKAFYALLPADKDIWSSHRTEPTPSPSSTPNLKPNPSPTLKPNPSPNLKPNPSPNLKPSPSPNPNQVFHHP